MALTLDETPKSATANTYASLAEANSYHEGHLDSAGTWAGADDATKNAALVMATRLLDFHFKWEGYATDPDQVLLWPRTGLLDFVERGSLDEDTYPVQLKNATAEFARSLIASDTTGDLAQQVQGLTALKVGSVALNFKASGIAASKPVPESVKALIPYHWARLRGAVGPLAERFG